MRKAVGYINDKMVELEVEDLAPEPYDWHVSERNIRLVLTDEVKTRLLTLRQEQELLGTQPEAAMIVEYVRTISAPTATDGTTTYIYLEELYPEHQVLLEKYGVGVETKSNYSK